MYDSFGRAVKESDLKRREKEQEEREKMKGTKSEEGAEKSKAAGSKRLVSTAKIISKGHEREGMTYLGDDGANVTEGASGGLGAGAAASADGNEGDVELSEEEQYVCFLALHMKYNEKQKDRVLHRPDQNATSTRMMKLLGIGGFETTKGEAVEDNQNGVNQGAVMKKRGQRDYRQYMNRKGGFNQLLNSSKSFRSTAR